MSTEQTTTATYAIPVENLGELETKLERLADRATKLGLEAPAYTIVERKSVEQEDGTVRRLAIIELVGEAPRINGWSLLAVLDHTPAGNVVRRLPYIEVEVPTIYRTAQPWCDHCRTMRNRADTYLVIHEGGEIKQVGSSCLRDFLGHADPHAIASYLESLMVAVESCEDEDSLGGHGSGGDYLYLAGYLSHVLAIVEQEGGYISRAKAEEWGKIATSDAALTNLIDLNLGRPNAIQPSEAHYQQAEQIIAWARATLEERRDHLTEYEWNLRAAIAEDEISRRSMGLAASVVSFWKLAQERKAEQAQAAAVSRHFGTVGKREPFTLTLLKDILIPGYYGDTHLYIFTDASGNRAKWFASNQQKLEVGETYTIVGTVKEHGDYQGVAETVLTRCKVKQ